MDKRAQTRYPVHDLIATRWSPVAFDGRPVPPAHLGSVLEAARWAPSSFNEQPWTFLVATRGDTEGHALLVSCLVEANVRWAAHAPVLMLSVARRAFARNGKPNRHAFHDVGLATENLVLQAQALGLATHQMAGFDVERARELLGVPEGHDPVTMIALGHPGSGDDLPADVAARDAAPRRRRSLGDIAHGPRFGTPLPLAGG